MEEAESDGFGVVGERGHDRYLANPPDPDAESVRGRMRRRRAVTPRSGRHPRPPPGVAIGAQRLDRGPPRSINDQPRASTWSPELAGQAGQLAGVADRPIAHQECGVALSRARSTRPAFAKGLGLGASTRRQGQLGEPGPCGGVAGLFGQEGGEDATLRLILAAERREPGAEPEHFRRGEVSGREVFRRAASADRVLTTDVARESQARQTARSRGRRFSQASSHPAASSNRPCQIAIFALPSQTRSSPGSPLPSTSWT